jgi:hypothetical protein
MFSTCTIPDMIAGSPQRDGWMVLEKKWVMQYSLTAFETIRQTYAASDVEQTKACEPVQRTIVHAAIVASDPWSISACPVFFTMRMQLMNAGS